MNFRILIPNATLNTIIATSLDGTDSIDIRYNSHSPHFSNVKSLTYHNNLFYWTTGTSIYGEEYHSKVDKYYRNKFLIKANYISNVKVLHIDSQPYPVPLNEVENVQALFQDETAKIFWSKPKLLNDVGKGAWQKWFYEIHLFDHVKNLTIFGNRTANNIYKIFTLRPNTTYSIKIRACSLGGKGEWSSEFVGKTLMQSTKTITF
ncbi:proto-oncogene tyrosine-protein kinase ROS-like [Centruroides sculpturatus]|uniref:proto-oncogene tyrosine-protein kinase ROS-like n=1 Tax=Centruroides sculpturatus TaxID=218467 RepID=UPI000C6D8D1A|nr:proto-oncogene tyrosine-protein kinase ROS-like [Centruroides sculpturatus]